MEKQLFSINLYVYDDVCSDSYFGKDSKVVSSALVFDTEQKVRMAVDRLNRNIHAHWRDRFIDNKGKVVYFTEAELDEMYEWGGEPSEEYYYYKPVEPTSALAVVNAYGANSLKGEIK